MNSSVNYLLLLLGGFAILFASCKDTPIPKPKGYFRIDLPEPSYTLYEGSCPLTFEKPNYMQVQHFKEMGPDSCWFNLLMPKLNASLHFTYLGVNDNLDDYLKDSYSFVFEHDVKASAIERERIISDNNNATGLLYDLRGSVASPLQMYMTDSTRHFLRASLYFNHAPNPDSVRPVLSYVRKDVERIAKTLQWK